jgi:short-subunit dehydrogenase
MHKTVLITGGSSGIGFELAKIFGKNGYSLFLVAQDLEKLKKSATELKNYNYNVQLMSIDLSDPTSPTKIYDQLCKENVQVDILVNNAGFATYGLFTETDLAKELSELQVNIVTLTSLTKLFARDMVKRRKGKILNVASTAAFAPGPLMAVYYASKSYVLSFSEALNEELNGTGVHVSALCPGPTDTGFVARGGLQISKLFQEKNMSSAFVAKIAYEGLMKNKVIIIPGVQNKLMVQGIRFAPRSLVTKIIKNIQEKREIN